MKNHTPPQIRIAVFDSEKMLKKFGLEVDEANASFTKNGSICVFVNWRSYPQHYFSFKYAKEFSHGFGFKSVSATIEFPNASYRRRWKDGTRYTAHPMIEVELRTRGHCKWEYRYMKRGRNCADLYFERNGASYSAGKLFFKFLKPNKVEQAP